MIGCSTERDGEAEPADERQQHIEVPGIFDRKLPAEDALPPVAVAQPCLKTSQMRVRRKALGRLPELIRLGRVLCIENRHEFATG
jgi:hypothetical protein